MRLSLIHILFELNLRTHIRKGEHGMEIIICDDNLSERSLMIDYILKSVSYTHLDVYKRQAYGRDF